VSSGGAGPPTFSMNAFAAGSGFRADHRLVILRC
jgi:hypothetical protein